MKTLRLVWNKVREKLKERSGETIVETLVSMLIVVLAVVMLAGSIVAAARVNAGAAKLTVYLNEAGSGNTPMDGVVVRVDGPGTSFQAAEVTVKQYDPDGESGTMYYYE